MAQAKCVLLLGLFLVLVTLPGGSSSSASKAAAGKADKPQQGSKAAKEPTHQRPDGGEKERLSKGKLTAKELETIWATLAGDDTKKAYQAIWMLVDAPEQSVPFLEKRLRPVGAPEPKRLAQLLRDLDSNSFKVRKKARAALDEVVEFAEPALHKALRGHPSQEVRKQINWLLDRKEKDLLQLEKLRAVRALEVLELIGSGEARKLLTRLAQGAPQGRMTQEAKASLERLARRPFPTRGIFGGKEKAPQKALEGGSPTRKGYPSKTESPRPKRRRVPVGRLGGPSGDAQLGKDPTIQAAAFSPDGKLAVSTLGRSITVWQIPSGKKVRTLHSDTYHCSLAFFPSGKQILAAGTADVEVKTKNVINAKGKTNEFVTQGTLTVWDIATGKEVRHFTPLRGTVTRMALSPDGKYAFSTAEGCPDRVWDVTTGKALRTLKPGSEYPYYSAQFSPDSRRIVVGSRGKVRLWDVATGKLLRVFSGDGAAAFSPSGRFVLVGVDSLQTWEVASGKQSLSVQTRKLMQAVAFLPDSRHALGLEDLGAPQLWNLRQGKLVRTFGWTSLIGGGGAVLSPDGRRVLCYAGGNLLLWDLPTDKEVCTLTSSGPYPKMVTAIAFSSNNKLALAVREGEAPMLWDLATGKAVHTLKGLKGKVSAVALSPDGKRALTGTQLPTSIALWDVERGRLLRFIAAPWGFDDYRAYIRSLAFSPDGKRALSAGRRYTRNGKGGMHLWELQSGKMIGLFKHEGYIGFAAFLENGKRIISHDLKAAAIKVWDVASDKLLRTFPYKGHWTVSVRPDGKQAILYKGYYAKLWDVTTGKDVRVLADLVVLYKRYKGRLWGVSEADVALVLAEQESGFLVWQHGAISGTIFSPDGRRLLWLGVEGGPWVTEVATGKLVREFPNKGVLTGVWARAFTPDGKLVRFEDVGRVPKLSLYDSATGRRVVSRNRP